MSRFVPHNYPGTALSTQPAAGGHDLAHYLVDWRESLRAAAHACCCPAKPSIVVIMPPAPGRTEPVDLLLCAHHYLVSQQALVSAGAAVLDTDGVPLTAQTRLLIQSGG